jgi:hypothetical protein
VPKLYSGYGWGNDFDLGCTLREKNATRIPGEPLIWEIRLSYSSALETEPEGEISPLARPPKKRWSTQPYQRIATHDFYGNSITNTAHDTFDPPAMADDSRLVMTYTKNYTEADMIFAFGFRDCVNSDMFQGFTPGEAKLTNIESERFVERAIEYWATTYEFHFRNEIENPRAKIYRPSGEGWEQIDVIPPWNMTLLNVGFHEIGAANDCKRILDETKRPTAQPVRLKLDGKKMDCDAPRTDTVYVSYEIYRKRPYSPLGII